MSAYVKCDEVGCDAVSDAYAEDYEGVLADTEGWQQYGYGQHRCPEHARPTPPPSPTNNLNSALAQIVRAAYEPAIIHQLQRMAGGK